MSEESGMKIELGNLELADYSELRKAMEEAYAGIGRDYWPHADIAKLLEKFPEGQLCVKVNGKVVASALSLVVDYGKFGDNHSFRDITGNDTFKTHDPDGDVLYGIEVFVRPEFRGMRLARRLYDARKELCENLNLRAIMAGGRIPNYEKYGELMTPREYIEQVRLKNIYDPTLTFQLSNGFHVKKLLRNYLEEDTQSLGYATLLEWNNIYYEEKPRLINRPRSVVRVGLVQWQMRLFADRVALMDQVEFFVDAISAYKADFILFPEFFNAPLMAEFNELDEPKAIREVSKHTEWIRARFQELAVSYNINIIAGSMPLVEHDRLYNVSFLLRRDGTWDQSRKIHPTPDEISIWGMSGWDRVPVFDTDCGRIGILICYDAEFPELARICADQNMHILFVPFLTDTQSAYMRVRICSQARAVENECYVAIAGSVGNLPQVHNMDVQYGQSAIFTPADFAFPTNSIKAETTPNTEMTVIADLDMDLLKELHEIGSVTNLKDRRRDLYEIIVKAPLADSDLEAERRRGEIARVVADQDAADLEAAELEAVDLESADSTVPER
ncbi:GNAT family N-acetyltransferase [Wenzhouxiangella sp. XN24]|nr:GNAT family N-acetyltransferase [Wenzhouxiangella sp. XN24]